MENDKVICHQTTDLSNKDVYLFNLTTPELIYTLIPDYDIVNVTKNRNTSILLCDDQIYGYTAGPKLSTDTYNETVDKFTYFKTEFLHKISSNPLPVTRYQDYDFVPSSEKLGFDNILVISNKNEDYITNVLDEMNLKYEQVDSNKIESIEMSKASNHLSLWQKVMYYYYYYLLN
jgi:hypothetical protein